MKQNFTSIREHLERGLAPMAQIVPGTPVLEVCHGLQASESRLRTFTAETHQDLGTASWPFPQLFGSVARLFAGGSTTLGTVNPATWAVTALTPGDATDLAGTVSIQAGGVWHLADFGDCWLATNGASLVMAIPHLGAGVWAGNSPVPKTLCNGYGTLVMGGMAAPAGTTWARMWDHWKAHRRLTVTTEDTVFGPEWVFFSQRDGGATDLPFAAELALLGYPAGMFESLESMFADRVAAEEAGFARLTGAGEILALHPLGNDVAVYGAHKVGMLRSVLGQDGVARWNLTPVADVGVAGRGAVAAGPGQHLFVGSDGAVWALTAEGVQRAGYEALGLGSTVSAFYDPRDAAFHFGTAAARYVWRNGAMSRAPRTTSGMVTRNEAGFAALMEADPGTFELLTAPLDMNQGIAEKTVQTVEVAGTDISAVRVSVLYRAGPGDLWRETAEHPTGPALVAYPVATGREFKLRVKGTRGSNGRIDYCYIRYQLPDFRHIRGTYAQGAE
jgi:hypothetical protein